MPVLARVLGDSAAIAAVREQAARVLRAASSPGRRPPPILILGETGTGKGLLADAIHRAGGRAAGPFVDVNCAAIPETLLEAELFGHERGAFTDARQAKAGLFQAASGGTIFLDEIGLMQPALQAKLLKAIEERVVRRLGSTRNEPVDAAIVAATSEDLAHAVRQGRFRADLYHRLAVVTLELPPLRERGGDVVVLAEHFLARACEEYGLPPRTLGEDARAALRAHAWPGNVRELANVLERAALLGDEPTLTARALGLPAARGATAAPADGESAERRALLDALQATAWNFTHAAARLGVPRNTLRYRAERFGLAPEGPPERRRGGRPAARRTEGASAQDAAADVAAPPPALDAFARAAPAIRPRHDDESAPMTAVEPAGVASADPPSPMTTGPSPVPAPALHPQRVTLVEVRLSSPEPSDWEASRPLEESATKMWSFGGRIEDLGPHVLLSVFGVEPDEDAPQRAAYAALTVRALASRRRARGDEIARVTIALHTEVVPVTAAGDIDPVALALSRRALADLFARAEPGGVVASAAAARFLARRFDVEPMAGDGAVRVLRRAEPRATRFVGRERELHLLAECFALAQAGQGQVVHIAGEPGIGKSRLLQELRRRLGRSATWVEGQALSFGRAMPLHPVIDMVRRVFRIEDADPEAAVIAKVERGVRELGPDLDHTLPLVRYLMSIDPGDASVRAMDPRRRQDAITAASQRLLERGAERRPHVVVLEDLHWCDPATEDWITRLADRVGAQRVLVVLTYRPGYRPAFGAGSGHTALALATLSGEESVRIAEGLLGAEALPAELGALVVDKSEGNPFFIEEIVRSLEEQGAVRRAGGGVVVASGIERVAVPDTVEDVILARTHRLDDRLRRVLDVAAVIGRTVPLPLLRVVAGGAEREVADDLRRLEEAEFLRETRAFPEIEYRFKHALTQDVAYDRIAPDERQALHGQIVDAIEKLSPDRLGDHVERLAYHAQRGQRWPAALRYARQAGAKAFDRSANREAVASFEQALVALAHLPPGPEMLAEAVDIRLALRSALLQLAELGAISRYLREAEALAASLGDRRRLAWVWTYLTITHLFSGDLGEALAVGERALAAAEEVGDVGLRASSRTPLAHACLERGDYRRAVQLFGEAIGLLTGDLFHERMGQAMPPSFYARSMAAICHAELGDFSEAVRLGAEAAEQTEALDLPFGLAMARVALGHAALIEGRLDDAGASLERALALIEARAIPTWWPWAAALRGYALALSGRADEGRMLLARAVERARALQFNFGTSQWTAWLAHAHLLAGHADDARRAAQRALDQSRSRGEQSYEVWALWVLGEIEAASGADAAATASYRAAHARADKLGMEPLAARCRDGLARLHAG